MGESAPEPTPPAALAPPPSPRARLAWYAGTVLVAAVFICGGLRLDATTLRAPLHYDYDSLLILPLVKATLERGSHWRNERLGYPGVQELHDFPVTDHVHFFLIWALGKVVPDAVVVFNLYYLLGYPLAAFTGMLALRYLGLTLPAAAAGGLLYAFLPYHYMRNETHYFLSAYWLVPISMLPFFWLCEGKLPFFRRDVFHAERLRLKTWRSVGLIALGAATASAGAYYAFFACTFYAVGGVYAWVIHRTWRSAASVVLLCGTVVAFGVVNHAPTIVYQMKYGRNPVTNRDAAEADTYGLKLAHLILPAHDHNLTVLSKFKALYNSSRDRALQNENECATLGAVGTLGLLGLLGGLLFRGPRGWPYGPLAATSLFVLLVATLGGFGTVFNLLVFDQIRCYNRISIYLAFVYQFVALWWLDRWLLTRTGPLRQRHAVAFCAVAALGLADQTPFAWFREPVIQSQAAERERFEADARYFGEIEASLPDGAKVFQLPMMPYPEYPPMFDLANYEPARGYVHTRTLLWSFGAMKGREADIWLRDVARQPPHELLRRAAARGFDGLAIDKRGFFTDKKRNSTNGNQKVNELLQAASAIKPGLRLPVINHEDGWQTFIDIRPYRDALVSQSREQFEAWEKEERESLCVLWLRGFVSHEPPGYEDGLRFASPKGAMVLVNPSDRTRTVKIELTFGVDSVGVFDLRFDSKLSQPDGQPFADHIPDLQKPDGAWKQETRNFGERRTYTVVLPPGRHGVSFRCRPPSTFMPPDWMCYFVLDFSMKELK